MRYPANLFPVLASLFVVLNLVILSSNHATGTRDFEMMSPEFDKMNYIRERIKSSSPETVIPKIMIAIHLSTQAQGLRSAAVSRSRLTPVQEPLIA